MNSAKPNRIRKTVYVIGAGFSAGLGYPLTKSLLVDVWDQLEDKSRIQLEKIIRFHHPAFSTKRRTSFPDIEQLLTEISVNLELFDASRPAEGNFTKELMEQARENLLTTIARWFHDLYEKAREAQWLSAIINRLRTENAAIVSFNWDLILDQRLFEQGPPSDSSEDDLTSESYGLSENLGYGPVLLKPHGSLNWYEAHQIQHVPLKKRVEIFGHKEKGERIEAFLRPREIKSWKALYTAHHSAHVLKGFQSSYISKALEPLHRCVKHSTKARFLRLFTSGGRFACSIHL